LIDRVLDQAVELTHDHQQVLADSAVRLGPSVNALSEAWAKAYQEIAALQPLPADVITRGSRDGSVQALLSELRQSHLRQAFAVFAAWGRQQALVELSYDLALKLLREYQRAMLPFLVRAYSADPQLPLVLEAFDDLFDGAATVLGAAYIESLPARFADSARLNVLGQLSGGAAHALNDLLTAIVGQTQLLVERTGDAEIRDELQEVQTTAAIGARVVRRLQDYARADRADQRVATDVNLLLRDTAEITRFLWRDQAEANGTVIDVVKDFADVPPVLARPSDLCQVFVALILNAVEAVPEGGVITLRTERKGNDVLASIIDDGGGIPEAVRVHIFEPFFTTKGTPHLGIGLSVAAQIVAAHNGTLTFESAPGRGTTFTLSLPVAQGIREEKGPKPMPTTGIANILVIDNERSVRDLLARLLKLHGHTVVVAEGGAEGIAALKAGKFDLVFTDLGMPEMSGWDVAREIKKSNPKVRVALTTGWPVELEPQELKERGVDQVVTKPFDIPQLLAMIDEALALEGR